MKIDRSYRNSLESSRNACVVTRFPKCGFRCTSDSQLPTPVRANASFQLERTVTMRCWLATTSLLITLVALTFPARSDDCGSPARMYDQR
jgi:hypothetical protein